jgi:hypothetical protein
MPEGRTAGTAVVLAQSRLAGHRGRGRDRRRCDGWLGGVDRLWPHSAIEGVASVVIIWRFSGSRLLSQRAEYRAQRIVAWQFFILAPFITYEALERLATGGDIETSWLGIGLTLATLAICQPLGYAKRRLGATLDSRATVGEGTQNLLCGYLAVAVLAGLLANTLFGLWWLDPIVALVIAGVAVQEGRKAWRGACDRCC